MQTRKLGDHEVSAIGLGCMNLNYAYGTPPARDEAVRMLNEAIDIGYTLFDTATMYAAGRNEELIREAIGHRRSEYVLTSKCGLFQNAEGKREINNDPALLKRQCEDSLRRLGTDAIDVYYIHRYDRNVPIEESVGGLADLVREGKIRGIGLSEVSAVTLRRAQEVHPIAAVQNEYSLWTRNPEIAVLDACRELGVTFVAFSPLSRGFLTGAAPAAEDMVQHDFRRGMPRFHGENRSRNERLISVLAEAAANAGVTPAQLMLAWLLSRGGHIVPIPGTARMDHLRENIAAAELKVSAAILDAVGAEINQSTVAGPRYSAFSQADVDMERFPEEAA